MKKPALAIITVVVFLLGLLMLFGAWGDYTNTQSFLATAIKTEGTVIDLDSRLGSKGSVTYAPVIEFKDSQNIMHQVTSDMSSNPPDFARGQKVEVRYQPQNPQNAKIDDFWELYIAPLLLGIVGTVLTLITGTILFRAWQRRMRKAWLLQNGEVIEASVSSIGFDTSIRVNGQCPYVVKCQYPEADTGFLREYKSERIWEDPSSYIKDKVKVYRDPSDHKKYYVAVEEARAFANQTVANV